MESYRGAAADASDMDQWVSCALQHAAPGRLELGLCCHQHLFQGPFAICCQGNYIQQQYDVTTAPPVTFENHGSHSDDDESSVVSSDDENEDFHPPPPWQQQMRMPQEYTVPRALFSCAELRSLSLAACRLAPPATVTLPSLETLLLSQVPDAGADVKRLIAGCPRLADLTLEACYAVTALAVHGGAPRLRRLAIRCCHRLATVAVDASELRAFEYRGAVPDASSFLTMHGGGSGRVSYCKVEICGGAEEEAASEEVVINLRRFLQLFANATHLHLESARLGSGLDKDVPVKLPEFSSLRHLEMRGSLPDNEDTGAIDAMTRILEHAPNLETVSLAFYPQERDWSTFASGEEEMLDAHHLGYSPCSVLAAAPRGAMIPSCLRSRVREINLVHYQGGTVQRALTKFLLCNAPAVHKLWCEFAEGPMFDQIQMMREIKGWLINKSANTHFA